MFRPDGMDRMFVGNLASGSELTSRSVRFLGAAPFSRCRLSHAWSILVGQYFCLPWSRHMSGCRRIGPLGLVTFSAALKGGGGSRQRFIFFDFWAGHGIFCHLASE